MNVVRISALSDDERMTLVEDDRSDDSEVDYEYTHDALNIHRRANVSSVMSMHCSRTDDSLVEEVRVPRGTGVAPPGRRHLCDIRGDVNFI